MEKITNIKVIYNNADKVFDTAYVTTADGKQAKIFGHKEINDYLVAFKSQLNKSSLKELTTDQYEMVKMYEETKNGEFVLRQTYYDKKNKWEHDHYDNQKLKIADDKDKYVGVVATGIKRPFNWKKAGLIIGGTVVAAGLIGGSIYGYGKYKESKQPKIVSENGLENNDQVQEKINPETWEQFRDEYKDTEHKEFFVNQMETNILPNIKTSMIGDKEYTYGLLPEEVLSMVIYYDSVKYSNEELLTIVGDFPFTGNIDESNDLVNRVNSGLDTLRLNLINSKDKENIMSLKLKDEEVNKLINPHLTLLWDKYVDLWVEFQHADTRKEKKAIRNKVQETMVDDFVDASNGVINLETAPGAHMILNTFPAAFATLGYPFDREVNDILVGTEADRDTVGSRGLVDNACSVINKRLENFENYRRDLILEDKSIDRENERFLLQDPTYVVLGSDYDKLTEDTYEYDTHDEHEGVMIPIMDNFVMIKANYTSKEDMEAARQEFRQATINDVNEKINGGKNSGPFNPKTNPSGGSKGDTSTTVEKGVEVDGSQLDPTQKKEAEDKWLEENDAYRNEEEVNNAVEEDKKNYEAIVWATYNHFIGKDSSGYDSNWQNSSDPLEREAWALGKSRAEDYLKQLEDAKNESGDKTDGADQTPDHGDNPNQKPQDEPTPPETQPPETQPPVEETEPPFNPGDVGEIGGDHGDNPNQGGEKSSSEDSNVIIDNGGSVDIITDGSNLIEDSVTTDDSDVWNPEDFGTYSFDDSDYEAAADQFIEMMAAPQNPEESGPTLTK